MQLQRLKYYWCAIPELDPSNTVVRLCWCKCGPKAPCQQHWGMSLEAPNQAQTQDFCSSARIVARGKKKTKKTHKHWSSSRWEQFRSGRLCSLRVGRVSPVPYFLLVKFRPLSCAADRILIRPVQSQRDSTPVSLLHFYCIKAFRLSGHCTTELTLDTSLTVAQRYMDYLSRNYEQHLKHPRHFSDTLKPLNRTPIFTTGLSK